MRRGRGPGRGFGRGFGRGLAGAALVALAACGGDGGSGAPPMGSPARPGSAGFSDAFRDPRAAGLGHAGFDAERVRALERQPRFTEHLVRFVPEGDSRSYQTYYTDTIGLAHARSVGLTGRGSTVSVVDDGFRRSHETFETVRLRSSGAIGARNHGTSVASMIAGDRYGVAPGASLHLGSFATIPEITRATNAAHAAGARFQNNSWAFAGADAVRLARSGQGGSLASRLRTAIGGTEPQVRAYLDALDRFARDGVLVFALENDRNFRGVPVIAGLPLLDARYTRAWIAVANGAVATPRDAASGLAARDGAGRLRIASVELLSQPCGAIAFTCLVAEGAGVTASAASDSARQLAFGASYTAPQVAGALAILAEAFPDTHPHDLRRRLLASANDGFFVPDGTVDFGGGIVKGYSDRYGHGVLDLRAALMPIGRLGFSARDMAAPAPLAAEAGPAPLAAGDPVPLVAGDPAALRRDPEHVIGLEEARLVAGRGMGDALARGLEAARLIVRDELGGGFRLPGAALVAARAERRDGGRAGEALLRFLDGGPMPGAGPVPVALPARDLARALAPGGAAAGFAAAGAGGLVAEILPDGLAVAMALPGGLAIGGPGSLQLYALHDELSGGAAVGVAQAVAPRAGLSLQLGAAMVDERDAVLGLRPAGRRAAPRGRSAAVNLGAGADLGRLFGAAGDAAGRLDVAVTAEIGAAEPARLGALGETGAIAFSSLGAEIGIGAVFRAGDRLTLSLSQPLRVERGTLALALPSEAGPGALAVPLAPSGRQVDLAVGYAAELLGATHPGVASLGFEAGALVSRDEGHRRGAVGAGAFAGISLRF